MRFLVLLKKYLSNFFNNLTRLVSDATFKTSPLSPIVTDAQFLPNKNTKSSTAYLDDHELTVLAKILAAEHKANKPRPTPWYRIKLTFAEEAKNLLRAVTIFNKSALQGKNIPPSASWLIDNYYILDKTQQQIIQELTPKLLKKIGPASDLCQHFLARRDYIINLKSFKSFILAYQEIRPLSLDAIGALPLCLRLHLVHKASEISTNLQNLIAMYRLSGQIIETLHKEKLALQQQPQFLAKFQPYLKNPNFVTSLYYQLREQAEYSIAVNWLKQNTNNCQTIASAFETEQAENCTSMANIIQSIKNLDNIEWEKWFSDLSLVDKMLSEHCDYSQLDNNSRAICREAIKEIANQSPLSELAVAENTIKLIQQHPSPVGHYLIGKARQQLEQFCKCHLHLSTRIQRSMLKYPMALMLGCVAAIAVPLCLMLIFTLGNYCSIGLRITFIALFTPFAIEVGITVFNKIIASFLPTRKLLGYDFSGTIPESYSSLVAIPTLLISKETIDELIQALAANYISNSKGELYYALITDWLDSKYEETEQDLQLLNYTRQSIAKLNQLYATSAKPRFFLCHRKRLFNPAQNCYMGWERKRGKLHELAQLLRGKASETSFIAEDSNLPANIKYLITLDSDTKLLPASAEKLIGKLAYSQQSKLGYSILQPRILNLITPAKFSSYFQQIFSCAPGIDPYSSAINDSYQDLFGQGIYVGKGIYDIDSFEQALQGKITENSVLSHDLLEGCYAGCALVSDVSFGEEYPNSYRSDANRLERWARGDWQLLPYIWRNMGAKKELNNLSLWQLLDNLRRWSLAPLFIFNYFLSILFLPPHTSFIWQISLVAAIFSAPLLALCSSMLHIKRHIYLSSHLMALAKQSKCTAMEILTRLCFMAHSAWYQTRAALISLYRLFISHKYLLEWKSASLANLDKQDLHSFIEFMFSSVIIAAFGLLLSNNIYFTFCALLWLCAPFIAYIISRPACRTQKISPAMAEEFKAFGERIWRFYENFCNAENNHLPIDNYQEYNGEKIAARTSPTNIGMYLLSIVAAKDFGWISLETALKRIENCLDSVNKLPQHKGHLYNWYDIKTLAPLPPFTISSVDNGNLAGHLIALSGALDKWNSQTAENYIIAECAAKLAISAKNFANSMDFSFLLCKKKQLLSIGYDITQQKLLPSCYDMLASEARLAYYVAIAKGDISYKIWGRMGRFLTSINGQAALLSWSGSMFEYLMPPLVLREEAGSITGQTNRLIIKKQIAYGRLHNRPWGISEAAFNAFDTELNYQYSNFGIPDLGLQRALAKNYVVAPYASLLAAQLYPKTALSNLRYLKKLGAYGKYGFFDAVDFTVQRLPKNATSSASIVVKNYYAHHHGMSLIAIYNLLNNNQMQDYFHANAHIKAYESLLQEQAPRCVAFSNFKTISQQQSTQNLFMAEAERNIAKPRSSKELLLLNSGANHIILNSRGQTVDHATALHLQQTFILKNLAQPLEFDLCAQASRCVFAPSSAQFYGEQNGIETRLNIIALAPNEHNFYLNGFGYELTLVNKNSQMQEIIIQAAISGAKGYFLNPPLANGQMLTLKPNAKQRLVFWYILGNISATKAQIYNYLEQPNIFAIEAQKSWAFEQARLFQMSINSQDAANYQKLLPAIIYQKPHPHIIIKIENKNYTHILRDMLTAVAYLRSHGLIVELTVINEAQPQDFAQLEQEICWLHQTYSVQNSAFHYITKQAEKTQLAASKADYLTLQAQRGFLSEQFAK